MTEPRSLPAVPASTTAGEDDLTQATAPTPEGSPREPESPSGPPGGSPPAGAQAPEAEPPRSPLLEEASPDAPVPEAARPEVERPPLPALLEAILLVTDEPVSAQTLSAVTGAAVAEVESALRELAADHQAQSRGFEIRLVAGGWRLYTRPDCAPYVERFLLDGQSARLTQAALETLAVIAYRQPVTRGRVSAVRGVNVDGVVRTLQARGLITDAGQDEESAGTLFRTTPLFLERLGLRSLEELPPLAPLLPELDELDDASTST